VICEEVFTSTSGFSAATPAFVVAPYKVALFILLMTLNPIPDPNVGRASKEQELPILVEVILTFHRIITIITQGREPSKVTVSKQIIGTADPIHPPRTIGCKAFVCVIVVSRLEMYCTKVLMYRTMVLLAHLTKVRC
jgi:hypothetical protein